MPDPHAAPIPRLAVSAPHVVDVTVPAGAMSYSIYAFTSGSSYRLLGQHAASCPMIPRADEAHQRWVTQITRRLRAALTAASEGRTFIWDEPDPAPGAYRFHAVTDELWSEDLLTWHTGPTPGGEK